MSWPHQAGYSDEPTTDAASRQNRYSPVVALSAPIHNQVFFLFQNILRSEAPVKASFVSLLRCTVQTVNWAGVINCVTNLEFPASQLWSTSTRQLPTRHADTNLTVRRRRRAAPGGGGADMSRL